jgi:hypothetical protein
LARLPKVKRFAIEEFQSQKEWIGNLLDPLNTFMLATVSALSNNLTFSENSIAQFASLKVRTATDLTPGTSYATTTSKTFLDADVNTGTEVITITTHGFATGDRVQLTTTGVLPTNLSLLTDYWVTKTGTNTLTLSSTLALAFAGTAVNITAAAGGGTHTISLWQQMPPYATLFETTQFKSNLKVKPVAVFVCSAVENEATPKRVNYGCTVDWTYANGLVVIENVSGLEPGREYTILFLAVGG